MEIAETWQNLEKNATQIMFFLPHYMLAENNIIQTIFSRKWDAQNFCFTKSVNFNLISLKHFNRKINWKNSAT